MLEIVDTSPINFGDRIQLQEPFPKIMDDIVNEGKVYCLKNCVAAKSIDALKKDVFECFQHINLTSKNIQALAHNTVELADDSQHSIVSGVSPFQKSLHYYHAYVFNGMNNLPHGLRDQLQKLFATLLYLYNDLTQENRNIDDVMDSVKRFRPQLVQYPKGGGMFATHTHPTRPQKIGIILGCSKRGRDYTDCETGFEAPNGQMIDTSDIHDLGDIIIFKYDVKHWVSFCDINAPLLDHDIGGRWTALLPIS